MQTSILKEGPVLISNLLAHKHLRGYSGFLPFTTAEVNTATPHLLVNKLLKLKAQVNIIETLLNERKLSPVLISVFTSLMKSHIEVIQETIVLQKTLLNSITECKLKEHTVSDCAGLSIVLGALMRLSSCAFLHWSAERFRRG